MLQVTMSRILARALLICALTWYCAAVIPSTDSSCGEPGALERCPWCDANLKMDDRVDLLVKAMSVTEKIEQLNNDAPAIDGLCVGAYNWWSEALHGVARTIPATSFPQGIALGATWNPDLLGEVASAISDEGRAIHNVAKTGLTFFTPNINIFRDPRWGRGQETYGEDPHLTSEMVKEYVRGMQFGPSQEYLKSVATPKHFAAYSLEHWNGIDRTAFDAKVSDEDLQGTYLPAFRAAVMEGRAHSIMCSYNSVNGIPSCANKYLLQELVRDKWGFKGFVASDCDAVANVFNPHNFTKTPEEAAAKSLLAGTDLDCGTFYKDHLDSALDMKMLEEKDIDVSVKRLFWHRFKLGMFDPPSRVRYQSYGMDMVQSTKNRELALQAAQESIVLLKNEDDTLPLDTSKLKSIAVIGPNADDKLVILGNYYGTPTYLSTHLDGIRNAVPSGVEVGYEFGCPIDTVNTTGIPAAVELAHKSDVAILYVGLNLKIEDEGHDRTPPNAGADLQLPGSQMDLVKAVAATGTKTIVVLVNGGPVAIEWIQANVPAIVEVWYNGQAAGNATASVLFGDYNPSGKLPVTIYPTEFTEKSNFGDMHMDTGVGRTYRFLKMKPLWPFGFGLSYTTFETSRVERIEEIGNGRVARHVTVKVSNTGNRSGAEVVQVWRPRKGTEFNELAAFKKTFLEIGETKILEFRLEEDSPLGHLRKALSAL